MKPIRLLYSPLTGRIYATRSYRTVRKTNEMETVEVTGQKDDVTDDIGRIMKQWKLEFKVAKRIKP